MRFVDVMFGIIVIALIVIAIIYCVKRALMEREPWALHEEETKDGLQWRFVALKPSHPSRVLTQWYPIQDYSELIFEERSACEAKVSDMNYGNKRLKK